MVEETGRYGLRLKRPSKHEEPGSLKAEVESMDAIKATHVKA